MLAWPFKDPDEVLDYQIDWSDRLAGDDITSSEFIVPDGIVSDQELNTSTTTTIWLSGGTEGETYQITNRIVTAGGRTMDQTVKLKVKSK